MYEYMRNLGAVLMLIAFANILVPEGNIKKYVSLSMGFILIIAALSVVPGKIGKISFSTESFEMSDDDIAKAQAEHRAQVLKMHRENMKKKIEEHMENDSKAYVEVSEEGEITSVTLYVRGDESEAVLYITNTLGVPRERIKIKYDEN